VSDRRYRRNSEKRVSIRERERAREEEGYIITPLRLRYTQFKFPFESEEVSLS
jgi:hypothetical protein